MYRIVKMKELIEQIESWCQQDQPELRLEYQVPLLGEGGTCSLFGELDETPFNLADELDQRDLEKLSQIQSLVNWVENNIKVDWFGIYLSRTNKSSEKVLTKLAYFGAPSRAEFPLNKEFATLSNNSTVGLTGEKKLINSVEQYRAEGGEYYTCDPKVKSELCWPIFSDINSRSEQQEPEILGIIDAESFKENIFDLEVQQKFEAVCTVLSKIMTTAK